VTKMGRRIAIAGALAILAIVAVAVDSQVPAIAAGGLLHPSRHGSTAPVPEHCTEEIFSGAGAHLTGWRCATTAVRRGTIVYLHGIADNRSSSLGAIQRLLPRGFDVIAYDSRAHGGSDGTSCTYGYYEKGDLSRVLDGVAVGPIVLIGSSLGGAVALQTAAIDRRVAAVVSAETFSDLATVARERAPSYLSASAIRRAFHVAEEQGQFSIEAVSPAEAARAIRVPVLLLHGAADTDTPPAHSQRVYDNLSARKLLVLVPGAHHNQALNAASWQQVVDWVLSVIPRAS